MDNNDLGTSMHVNTHKAMHERKVHFPETPPRLTLSEIYPPKPGVAPRNNLAHRYLTDIGWKVVGTVYEPPAPPDELEENGARKWTDEEDELIREKVLEGKTVRWIAKLCNRSEIEVRTRSDILSDAKEHMQREEERAMKRHRIDRSKIDEMLKLKKRNMSHREIGRRLKVSDKTVARWVARAGAI